MRLVRCGYITNPGKCRMDPSRTGESRIFAPEILGPLQPTLFCFKAVQSLAATLPAIVKIHALILCIGANELDWM